MIRKYEACILLDPGLDHSELEEEINNILEILRSSGTNVVHHELWGRRTLMYPIKKKTRGIIIFFTLKQHPMH